MSVNKVILLGNVGNDPEMSYPQKDYAVATFPLATSEARGTSGQEVTEWHRIVMTGKNASFAERYIRKGTKLYLEGKLRSRRYTDRFNIERRITEIFADTFEILGRSAQ